MADLFLKLLYISCRFFIFSDNYYLANINLEYNYGNNRD